MTLTRGFSFAYSPFGVPPEAVRFDYYSASLDETVAGADVVDFFQTVDLGSPVLGTGHYGYANRVDFMAGRRRAMQVMYGGSQARPLVVGSGATSGRVAELLRKRWPEHRVTRVDSAVDWDAEAAWPRISAMGLEVAKRRGIKTSVAGDWLGKLDGRTLYIGGKSSAFGVRIYEKGKQVPEAERPWWVRMECEWRPKRENRAVAASLAPVDVWGASPWGRELLEATAALETAPVAGPAWMPPDDLRARSALLRQYGSVLGRWADEVGGMAMLLDVLEVELRSMGVQIPETAPAVGGVVA